MGGLNSDTDSQASVVLKKYDNLLDYLCYYLCPIAIRIGMTYTQFWEEDPEIFWIYLEAHKQDLKEKFEYDNSVAFLQGQYFMLALAQCLQFSKRPKKIYPEQPFNVTKNETPEEIKQMQFTEQRKTEMKARCEMFKRIRRM